ncbi:MAG: SAM-dependent methyltransferase, partial [Firmicutes bacterium]|nr:SAM-dependent methyltransferase [Bacillota bacterium]
MPEIIVAGLGYGAREALPDSTYLLLKRSPVIYLRTRNHPVVPWLAREGVHFQTFDHLYEAAENFPQVYRQMVETVVAEARQHSLVFAVPGHPLVAEEAVQMLLPMAARAGLQVRIIPAMSFLDALFVVLNLDPAAGLQVIDGLRLEEKPPVPRQANVVLQVYNTAVASNVKLALMEYYPDEFQVTVVRAAGVPGEEKVERLHLYRLDRLSWVDHLTCLYLPPYLEGAVVSRYPLDPLAAVMARLLGEKGCPWDREQDHGTLRRYLLEEAYEVVEAIDRQDMYNICEELGDLLLQIVFHAQIALESGQFNINDVVNVITEKLIRRHPHVFGDAKVENS